MTIKTITHSESREYINSQGLKRWKKKSIEAEIDLDTEDVYECYGKLEDIVDTSLNMSEQVPVTDFNTGQQQSQSAETERLRGLIDSCTSPDELENYYDDAVKYGLSPTWDKKLKSLKTQS